VGPLLLGFGDRTTQKGALPGEGDFLWSVYIYIYIDVCTYTYIDRFIYGYVYMYMNSWIYIYVYICVYKRIYINIHTCICRFISTYTCMYIYVCTYPHAHVYNTDLLFFLHSPCMHYHWNTRHANMTRRVAFDEITSFGAADNCHLVRSSCQLSHKSCSSHVWMRVRGDAADAVDIGKVSLPTGKPSLVS